MASTVSKNQPHVRLNIEEINTLISILELTPFLNADEEALRERLVEAQYRITIQNRGR